MKRDIEESQNYMIDEHNRQREEAAWPKEIKGEYRTRHEMKRAICLLNFKHTVVENEK